MHQRLSFLAEFLTAATFLVVGVVPSANAQTPSVPLSHGSCPPIELRDLASPDRHGDEGLLPQAFDRPLPRLLAADFHVVCEVAGITRETVSAVSFVARYECLDPPCADGENVTMLTEQFQYNCSTDFFEMGGTEVLYERAFPRSRQRTLNPAANFSTETARGCGLCVDPAFGVDSDPVTHCFRKWTRPPR